jgi:hypothetical protein
MAACPRPRVGAGRDRKHFRLKPELLVLEERRLPSTFTVTSTADDGSTGTLRWAIAQANANSGANTIDFDPTAFGTPQAITLGGSQLELSNTSGTQTITGPAAGATVSGGGKSRVFQIDGGVKAAISGLTITGGSTSGAGGGLYAQTNGTLTLTGCIVSGNRATGGGGGLFDYGTVSLSACTVSANSGGNGGGLSNAGTMTLTGCTVSGNTGDGLYNKGHVSLSTCTFSGNSFNIGQIGGEGIGGLKNAGTMTLTGCTVSGNSGDGLYNVGTMTLTGCTVSGNSGGYGGGLNNAGTMTLTGCTVSGNTGRSGGGLCNKGPATATLIACTVSGNSAGYAGGLWNYAGGGLWNNGTMGLTDCTIASNSAHNCGGGLYNRGTLTVTACTIASNSATNGGGLYNYSSQGPTLTDTIVADNTDRPFHANDISSNTSVTGGYNLIGPGGAGGLTNGSNGNIVLTSLAGLGLTSLGAYGGPTETIALLPGSPALGAGKAVPPISTDQRGEPLDTPNPDIGAFQSQGFTLTPAPGSTPQSTTVGTAFANPLAVTLTANNSNEPTGGGIISFTAPAQGASATLSATTATIDASGVAQVNATANSISGSYAVTASAATSGASVNFVLTNIAQPVFSTLAGPTITYSTPSVTLSGTILAGSTAPPGSVSITVNGDTQLAAIQANGHFSSVFNPASLGVAGSPYIITYAYAATVGFLAATDTSQVLTVTPAAPAVTWPNPADITFGTALGTTQLDATTTVPGTFTYKPAAGTTLPVGAGQTLSVTFTPTDPVDYKTAAATATINVDQATPTINWPDPASIDYGTALSSTQLDARANVPGTFTYTPAAGTVLTAGSGQVLSVRFTPTDTVDYTTTTATVTINVPKAMPVLTWANPASIVYGAVLGSSQLDAAASVPGTFTYTPAAGSVLKAGAGQTLSVRFAPTDLSDYMNTSTTTTINVGKATPTISLVAPGGTFDGSPFSASVTIAGAGTQATPAASLEAIAPALTYYLGSGTSGTGLGSTPPIHPGTYTVATSFPGSADYTATQSSPVTFTIDKSAPGIVLIPSIDSSVFGEAVTLVASVAFAAAPGGSLTFYDGSTPLGTVAVDASGTARLTTTSLAVGSHSFTAAFDGNADLLAGVSEATAESVSRAATRVVLVPQPVFKNKRKLVGLSLKAEVHPMPPGAGVPTGLVTFEVQNKSRKKVTEKVLATMALSDGSATLTVKPNSVFKEPITIVYSGDSDFIPSRATPSLLTRKALQSTSQPTGG